MVDVKYARLVFEEEIPTDATEDEITEKIRKSIENYIKGFGVSIDDIEIADEPYIERWRCGINVK